jgi:hypothetical protein
MGRNRAHAEDTAPEAQANSPQGSQPVAPQSSETAEPGQPSVKKIDMARAALAEGLDNPAEAVAWIKARYGIDLPKAQFSSYKSQLKAKEARRTTNRKTAPPRARSAGCQGQ